MPTRAPKVSIILPTYNRGDVLGRAVTSVQRQTFPDWELIIVDDGSTDNTKSIVQRFDDPRIRFVSQPNGGCYAARNTGLRLSRGELIAFLDSDDEWYPYHLELCVALLQSSSDIHFVMTESWEDWGDGSRVLNDHDQFAHRWPRMARIARSTALNLPPGETDAYMRVFQSREPVGEWGAHIARAAGYPEAKLYRGQIFSAYRWGHIGWLPTTVITRHALQIVGLFDDQYRAAADYYFLALLAKHFEAYMIGVPTAVKHLRAISGNALAEDHIATGRRAYVFATSRLQLFDRLFLDDSRENRRIRGLYQLYAGRTALKLGQRREAMRHFREAHASLPASVPAWALHLLTIGVPSGTLTSWIYRQWLSVHHVTTRLWSGELTIPQLFGKILRRLLHHPSPAG